MAAARTILLAIAILVLLAAALWVAGHVLLLVAAPAG